MSPGLELCGFSDRDAWDLVAQIVVRESAVAAGLRVAAPYEAEPANRSHVAVKPSAEHRVVDALRPRVRPQKELAEDVRVHPVPHAPATERA